MEAMGLHLPGASLVNPDNPLRDALTSAAGRQVTELTALGDDYTPVGAVVDERAIVNGCVALLATGGSTNHTMHLVAIARAAGIALSWSDIAELSAVVPLIARIYPNGRADVNHFHAAGGMACVMDSLLDAGLMHEDVRTVTGTGLRRYTTEPKLDGDHVRWTGGARESLDTSVLRTVDDPFAPDGGLKTLEGNLGISVIKTSAVDVEHRSVTAPAVVFDSQHDFLTAFETGALERDFVAVLRYQGPQALGMPELHKLTPALGVLQDRGHRVALVTDGRMSGASGKVPAAIHLTPEAAAGGPLARVVDGDRITVDADAGILTLDVGAAEFARRKPTGRAPSVDEWVGTGRELFASLRCAVGPADQGATVFPACSA
jgi:phosphogluconate dehydratase